MKILWLSFLLEFLGFALSEITNTLTKVVAHLDAREKILKITTSASSSSSCSESQKTKVPLIVHVSKSL